MAMQSIKDFSSQVGARLARPGSSGSRLQLITQLSATECGLACLAMVLASHGRKVSLRELRRDIGPMSSGVTMAQLADAAASHRLISTAYRIDLDDLSTISPASILHWDLDHFVVLGRRRGKRYEIYDPAGALFLMTLEEISKHFTGVVMCFEAHETFEASEVRDSPLAPHLRKVLSRRRELIAATICSVFLQALGFSIPIAFVVAIQDVIPWQDLTQLWVMGVGVVLAALAKGWALIIRGRILAALNVELESEMRSGFLFHFKLSSAAPILRLSSHHPQRRSPAASQQS